MTPSTSQSTEHHARATSSSEVHEHTADNLRSTIRSTNRRRLTAATILIAIGLLASIGLWSGGIDGGALTRTMSFRQWVQTALNNVDIALAWAGRILLPIALIALGTIKLISLRGGPISQIDTWSSQELTELRTRPHRRTRGILQLLFAGTIPILATAGVALGALTSSIGNEISNGPSRPIVTALTSLTTGHEMVVAYKSAMPMVESDISLPLAERIQSNARSLNIHSYLLDLDLGTIVVSHMNLTALSIGVDVPRSSPIYWSSERGCQSIPIEIDPDSGATLGSNILLDGVSAHVVGLRTGLSAVNRIGLVLSRAAMATCLKQDAHAPVHAVVLDSSPRLAALILSSSNTTHETATVISTSVYIKNSQLFWTSNVKPITNILALAAAAVAIIAMSGAVSDRILRNRREYAAKLASGVSIGALRATEVIRATKDGIVASFLGCGLALVIIPLTNTTEPGLQNGLSLNDALVGSAIGILGCLAGALLQTSHLQRAVNVSESTRI